MNRPAAALALLLAGCGATATSPYLDGKPPGLAGTRFDGVYEGRGLAEGRCGSAWMDGRLEVRDGNVFWRYGLVGEPGTLDASGRLEAGSPAIRLTGTFDPTRRFTGTVDYTGTGCLYRWAMRRV